MRSILIGAAAFQNSVGAPGKAALRKPLRGPRRRPFVRNLVTAVILTAVSCGSACADPPVRVFAIRGFAGDMFSRGMSKLCEELQALPQVTCTVGDFFSENQIEREASIAVMAGQKLVLVGHSLGANAALQIAAAMPGSVPLLVTIDPNWFPTPAAVPSNVSIALNYYQNFDMFGHAALTAVPGYRGELLQFVRREPHHLIDQSPEIHAEIVTRIRSILAGLSLRQRSVEPIRELPVGAGSFRR